MVSFAFMMSMLRLTLILTTGFIVITLKHQRPQIRNKMRIELLKKHTIRLLRVLLFGHLARQVFTLAVPFAIALFLCLKILGGDQCWPIESGVFGFLAVMVPSGLFKAFEQTKKRGDF